MRDVARWLRGFAPAPVAVNHVERIRACCGALIGVLLTSLVNRLVLGPTPGLPLLLAPMGASAVLLFAAPASPLAQPWSVLGGNLTAAAIGVTCAQWVGDPLPAAALALAMSIGMMFALRCLHPPSGALALTAVLGGPAIEAQGYHFVLSPVAVDSALLLLTAILFNNLTRRRYPHPPQDHRNPHRTADALPGDRLGFTPADLEDVLKQYNQVLDVSRDDLETIFLQTEMHAYRRRFGEITCADIMSRDLVTVESGTTLQQAWSLMRRHRIKAMPVIDGARRITGIVTLSDFMRHAQFDAYAGFGAGLHQVMHRAAGLMRPHKPKVVGQIMTTAVVTAKQTMHIAELVQLLSDRGLHHIPVVEDERRLVGMVTQSDLIAALYRGRLVDDLRAGFREKRH